MKKNRKFYFTWWKTIKILTVFMLLVISITCAGTFAFAADDLPTKDAFKPDSDSFSVAQVFVTVIVFIAGIIATVYFAIGIIKVIVKDVKELIAGEASLDDKKKRFTAVGVGFVILLLVISGKWYDVLLVIWNKIINPILNKLG